MRVSFILKFFNTYELSKKKMEAIYLKAYSIASINIITYLFK